LPSFGENLRREREKRNITLDQISQSTKIGTRMLQALEEDKFNQLPGGIFNKGFVRAYARCVGLDEEQTVADFLLASGETPPLMPEMPVEQPAPRIIEASAETPRRPIPWGLLAALLLLAALALSLWSHRQEIERETSHPSTGPAATQPPTEGAAGPAPAVSVAREATSPQAANVGSAQQASQPIKSAITETSVSSPAPALPETPTFVVSIEARDDSWTVITSDGRTVYSGLLAAGDRRAIRGHQQIVVRAGNAGGVDLLFNGKKIPQPGQVGEVRTITFGPEGVTPAAAAPPLH
jgi:cytoskeleton protein RodZ